MTNKQNKLFSFDHQKLQKIKNKPNQEIMIVLNEKHNFILRKEAASKLAFFQRELLDKGLRVCFINRPFNVGSFEKIMQLISGEVCSFEKTREILQLFEIGNYFDAEIIKKILVDELFKNFEKYSVFLLLEFGLKFNQTQIKEKCIYELVHQNFEQFNFNRLQFLQCNPQMFTFLISLHFNFTKNNRVKGLSSTNIKQIIKEYGSFHGLSLEKSNVTIKKQQILQLENLLKQRINYFWKEFRTPSFSLTDLSESIDFSQSQQASRKKSLGKTSDTFRIQSSVQICSSENDGNTQSSESDQIEVLLIQSNRISTSIDDNLQKQEKENSQKVNLIFENSDKNRQKVKMPLMEKYNQKH